MHNFRVCSVVGVQQCGAFDVILKEVWRVWMRPRHLKLNTEWSKKKVWTDEGASTSVVCAILKTSGLAISEEAGLVTRCSPLL
jgi:flavin reductase (DIM6/NTAB) family NADH-FMN oxidoreductase RutF